MKKNEIVDLILSELKYAEKKHPYFPTELMEGINLISEELGELSEAANDYRHHNKKTYGHIKTEAAHIIVTAVRFLKNYELYEKFRPSSAREI